MKTLSNYTNHITHTPLDAAFNHKPGKKGLMEKQVVHGSTAKRYTVYTN